MLYIVMNSTMANKEKMTIEQRNELASNAEKNDQLEKAIGLYEENTRAPRPDEFAFQRLMIIYRKSREYKKELDVINRGIKAFKTQYAEQQNRAHAGHKDRRKIARLSSELMKKLGLADKKGNELYQPEPIGAWLKRKELVEKKIGKR